MARSINGSLIEPDEKAEWFVALHSFALPTGWDSDLRAGHAFRVEATPPTFPITPSGEIRDRHTGVFPAGQLNETLVTLLNREGA